MWPMQEGTGGVAGVQHSTLSISDFGLINYLELKPGGMGGVLQSGEGGEGGAIEATLASRSTREGTW